MGQQLMPNGATPLGGSQIIPDSGMGLSAAVGYSQSAFTASSYLFANPYASNAIMSNGAPVLRGSAARGDWQPSAAATSLHVQVRACSIILRPRLGRRQSAQR